LEWGGGRLLNGFVEASILISVYYVDQNSTNVRHCIIAIIIITIIIIIIIITTTTTTTT